MSRDRRQRAKQRERRRAGAAGAGELVRTDVPGALDHASGEVDEFDAALVRGAGGVPLSDDDEDAEAVERVEQGREQAAATETVEDDEDGDRSRENGGRTAVGNVEAQEEDEEAEDVALPAPRVRAQPPTAARGSLPSRAVAFLRACWAELQRVQWPDRPEVFQATAVVLGFVAVMGVYLGVADWVAQKIINFVL